MADASARGADAESRIGEGALTSQVTPTIQVNIASELGKTDRKNLSSGQGTSGGAQTRDRRVPAHLMAQFLSTVPPMPQKEEEQEVEWEAEMGM
ncbi:hypothetical protein PoB_005830700 [Plakobranchus ocellatus]|uniref:Uncharacterized protein n=1 Tax=Plakobranchus ocellatus TaxID=259542 RepID=A0AAV4CK97_9GAST|nr:hypothetical protein PoB_005830700 [Plakobranchus ocellatus]